MNPTSPLRIGILGLHHDHVWGELGHATTLPDVEVVAAADPYPELRDRFKTEYGRPAYEEYRTVLDDSSLDAALVFACNRTGASLAADALEAGLAVLVEKPMAADLAGAERLFEAGSPPGRILMINWPYAWWPALQQALQEVEAGTIGRLWGVRYRAAHAGPEKIGCSRYFCNWLFDAERNGGGALYDYACYGANLTSLLLGAPRSLLATVANLCKPELPVDDNATVLLRYPDGQATLEASWTQAGNLTSYVTALYGETGTLVAEPHDGRLLLATDQEPEGWSREVLQLNPLRSNAIAHFAAVIRGDDSLHPLCTPATGLAAQRILEWAKLSAAEHREISLDS